MKIILVSEALVAGGAETSVIRLANMLSSRHSICLAVLHGERLHPDLVAQLEPEVNLVGLRLPAKFLLWKVDSALRLLGIDFSVIHYALKRWFRRLLKEQRPDLVHSHLLKPDRLVAEVKAGSDIEFAHVTTMHGDYAPYLEGHSNPLFLKLRPRVDWIIGQVDAIIALSREHLNFFAQNYPEAAASKVHLIYNGYAPFAEDYRKRSRGDLNLPADKFLFGMVSRGVEKKGWSQAIAAFESLGRKDAALVLVGEGPFIDKLRQQRLPDGVILAGFSPNPVEFIQHFDVCLLPSLFTHESLPTVVMEYLFCGKPVIATDVGEIPAMLTASDGTMAGQLLTFRGGTLSVPELQRVMSRMMTEPLEREEMARAAVSAFQKFDLGASIRAHEALYQSVVERHAD